MPLIFACWKVSYLSLQKANHFFNCPAGLCSPGDLFESSYDGNSEFAKQDRVVNVLINGQLDGWMMPRRN